MNNEEITNRVISDMIRSDIWTGVYIKTRFQNGVSNEMWDCVWNEIREQPQILDIITALTRIMRGTN